MDKSELKKTTSIRVFDPHKKLFVQHFGSVQKAMDALAEFLEKAKKKEVAEFRKKLE